jgi:hypothetical protein
LITANAVPMRGQPLAHRSGLVKRADFTRKR